ncbi:MAG TPA: hypothetical protein VN397_00540 [Candidatus Methylomirabilis sp.]|nr:hypothetical protein [Candidatus Methylomirabilis sp.]
MVSKNPRVGFTAPSRSILESVPISPFPDLEHAVPDQLMLALRTVSFGDVARLRSWPKSISAIGGIAFTIIKSSYPHFDETEVVNLIAALDPLVPKHENEPLKTTDDLLETLSSLPPVVDTFLEEIDPEKISPRTFVAKSLSSDGDWLDKTNDAEKAHEQILKDLVVYLKGKGFKVYKTRSFDLFAEKGDARFLWEVKSANGMNSISQGEKGIVQLLRYSVALTDAKWENVKFFLLLQDSGQRAVHQYLSKIAKLTRSELWLYDEKKAWPKRVFNLGLESIPSA